MKTSPLKELEITYGATTGPHRMKIDEARRTGIDIGEGNQQNGGRVYEIAVKFKAALCLAGLKQGDVIGVGIMTGTAGREKHKEKTNGRPGSQFWRPAGRWHGQAWVRQYGGKWPARIRVRKQERGIQYLAESKTDWPDLTLHP